MRCVVSWRNAHRETALGVGQLASRQFIHSTQRFADFSMAAERVTICTQQIEERPHQETCLIESTRGNHN